jgi:hypothetical protein
VVPSSTVLTVEPRRRISRIRLKRYTNGTWRNDQMRTLRPHPRRLWQGGKPGRTVVKAPSGRPREGSDVWSFALACVVCEHVVVTAVFVTMGGTGYAAVEIPRNSVGGSQLKANFKASELPAGATGATGPQGAKGDAGTNGLAGSPGTPGDDGTAWC